MCKHFHLALTFAILSVSITHFAATSLSRESVTRNPITTVTETTNTVKELAGSIESRLAKAHSVANPALVRVYGKPTERGLNACTGVIATEQGHILVSSQVANQTLTVHLSDGRQTTAKALGWSNEWGIALAKLEGEGPWPHVKIDTSKSVRAGQDILTFAYSISDVDVAIPLMDLQWVNRVAPSLWFMHPNGTKLFWKQGSVAFDLDGNLLGLASAGYPYEGTVFTDTVLVQTFWNDLIAGKNIDRERLGNSEITKPSLSKDLGISKESLRRAVAASVRVRSLSGNAGVSGTIISKDGIVATVAHHFVMPGGIVNVFLPDGRDFQGKVIGSSFPSDIGLVRIEADVELPFVEMGHSTKLQVGDPCLVIGYGPVTAESRIPEIRRPTIVEPFEGLWSYHLPFEQEAAFVGGDCGSGVFDVNGSLVAIASPNLGVARPYESPRIEAIREQWESLHAPFHQAQTSELSAGLEEYAVEANNIRDFIVELQYADETIALGTIVDAAGTIVTKASVLPTASLISCKLPDGRVLQAQVTKIVREHDLAVLKVAATELKSVTWSNDTPFVPGMLAVVAGPKPSFGTIALPLRRFAPRLGHLRASFIESENGLVVDQVLDETIFDTAVTRFGPQPLQKGDILLSVEDRPLTNLAELDAMLDDEKMPIAVAGDTVRLLVQRSGKQLDMHLTLGPRQSPIGKGQSARCSNFAAAASFATNSDVNLFGGPVVNFDGRAIGIAIAGRQRGWVLVLPAEIVRRECMD